MSDANNFSSMKLLLLMQHSISGAINKAVHSQSVLLNKSNSYMLDYNNACAYISNEYDKDSIEYEVEMDKLDNEKESFMAALEVEQNALAMEITADQNELQVVNSDMENFEKMYSDGVKEHYKYCT